MRVLALEPYYGGSHQAFLDGWRHHSRHDWSLLTLPPNKWKWRMRHSAITFADQVRQARGEWDLLLCSDMLNLAEFLGLARGTLPPRPTVAYFHENQLTYPVRREDERDYHFAISNLTTALAADAVWFNSAFHRDEFLTALPTFIKRMPDHQPLPQIQSIRAKAEVHPPGICPPAPRGLRRPGPLRILWAARWEHDKNPETFFEALGLLQDNGVPFRVSVLGEQFRAQPPIFDQARSRFAGHIDRWGYQTSRAAYEAALADADVIVSTAVHEFFGISIVEAIAAGAFPVLPDRLSYPEILEPAEPMGPFLYDGSAPTLARALRHLAATWPAAGRRNADHERAVAAVRRYQWAQAAPRMDQALEALLKR